ncbi:thioredoxin family protein [Methylococcus sp. ANG]|uniref:thioredoxin family protein n=1 Tax=Methylococcus sp. ANG TaxID=3231903 RepID=UPI003458BDDE
MSLLIRNFLLSLLLAVPLGAGAEPCTQTAFERLQKEGTPILVSIHADWCPTCRAQAPIVQSLLEQNPYRRIQLLRVDFDERLRPRV